nr:LamG-like jellyroll fold domain-containing protein [uncultured Desulfobacter sp.]
MTNRILILSFFLGVVLIFFPCVVAANVSDGLLAYYPFDGDSNDISGNGNHGTESGGLTYKMGVSGEAASFDGVDDYIRVPSHSTLNPEDQLTISFWIKVDNFTNTWSPLIHKGGAHLSESVNREYTVWLQDISTFHFASAGDNLAQQTLNACCAGKDIWTHFVGVIDRQQHKMRIYVNGILKNEITDAYSTFNNNLNDLIIGWTEEISSSYSPFKGRLDELRIYSRALSEDEVSILYNTYSNAAIPNMEIVCESNFNSGLEGWAGYSPELRWNQSGGNPGGYLRWSDAGAPSKWLSAPSKFTGDWSYLDGDGYISFDQYIISTGNYNSRGRRNISISGPGGSASWSGPKAQTTGGWYSFLVPLKESCWSINSGSWSELLKNVSTFSISPEFYGNICCGTESTGTDNVRILKSIAETIGSVTVSTCDTIQTFSEYEASLVKYGQENIAVQLKNISSESQSIYLEIENPYSDLSVIVSQDNPVTIESGETQNISIDVDAGTASIGVFDGILLKITTENCDAILYSNLNIIIAEPGTQNQPDLSISSQDIQLTDYTLGDTATLQAVVNNQGITAASDVKVQFYELGTLLGEATLTEIVAQGTGTATITIPIGTSEGDHLIQVVVDSSDSIPELDETNNAASKIVTWGTPSVNAGNILVTGSSPSIVYAGDLFTVSGKAVYDVYVDGTRYTDYVVKGGSVQITIKDDAGNKWIYGGIHTDTNGNFNKYLQAPSNLDKYQLSMTVTDKTFSGTRGLVFQVVAKPDTPQEPPAPPTITGTGYWTYTPSGASSVSGTWTWTWTSPPVNEPVTQTDLRIFSENIYFSNDNPDPEEDITIFAEINYWATRTDITAEDVPVNLYATYPGSDKEKIGSTVISSLSAGSSNFGSQYIYGTWKNQDQGIYFIEVEIDPSFTEENMLNNAATRAVIVGALESNQGVIQGQVTNAWGGVEDVTVELYDEAATMLISSTLTASTGHYCFESLPVGNYQVHIVTPDGYETEADTRPAEVLDQEITEVDFYLTQVAEKLCGDLDGDGDVDDTDRNILRAAFGTVEGYDGFVAEADYDLDGNIDYSDYQLWYYCYKQYVAGL